MSAELLDSTSDAQLDMLVDREAAALEGGGQASWEQLQSELTFYAQRFRGRWDAARACSKPAGPGPAACLMAEKLVCPSFVTKA